MTKHVPEGSVQINALRQYLLGNKVFGSVRGNLDKTVLSVVTHLMSKAGSPSEFCRLWDSFAGNVRVMANKLAQYERDGWSVAKDALIQALRDEDYMIPTEVVPLESTTALTVVIPDPVRTFHMVRWICHGHWMDLDRWLRGESKAGSLVDKLYELFPTLKNHSARRNESTDYEGWDLRHAFKDSVTDVLKIHETLSDARPLTLAHGQFNDHIELLDGFGSLVPPMEMAYVVLGDQGDVLSRFSRSTQQQLASWQLHIPTAEIDVERYTVNAPNARSNFSLGKMGFGSPRFCFHPSDEHEAWTNEYPSITSKGVSQGFGLLFDVTKRDQLAQCAALENTGHYGWQGGRQHLRFALS